MLKRFCFFALQAGIVVLFILGSAHAQTTAGLITGTITDQSGAVVPEAQVELTEPGHGRATESHHRQ